MAKILIFSDGTKAKVKEDNGKFWVTEKAQFRKSNSSIVEVVEEKETPEHDKAKDKPKKSQPKKEKDDDTKEEPEKKSE